MDQPNVALDAVIPMPDDSPKAGAIVVMNHGHPLLVLLDIDEFIHLKAAAGEPVPPQVLLVGSQVTASLRAER